MEKTQRRTRLLLYAKLVYRSVLLLAATGLYILGHTKGNARPKESVLPRLLEPNWISNIIWLVFAVEMLFRFFPSRLESMGCQKQFKKNYRPTGFLPEKGRQRLLLVLAAWLILNGILALLYFDELLDEEQLLLISLVYSVCDIICILFFCPFQTWFMKNKCCTTCRIYNWDYAMMFTPLLLVPSVYTWSLVVMALALLVRWEVTYALYPERFYEKSNGSLTCSACQEKLCRHKRALQKRWKKRKKS